MSLFEAFILWIAEAVAVSLGAAAVNTAAPALGRLRQQHYPF